MSDDSVGNTVCIGLGTLAAVAIFGSVSSAFGTIFLFFIVGTIAEKLLKKQQ